MNGKQPKCKLHFGDNIVNQYCYLGVMITACGSFSSAMKMLYKKGIKAIFCLLNSVNKTKQLPVKILLDLSDKMIFPVISYNCEKWGASLLKQKNYSEQNLVENLFTQRRASSAFCRSSKTTFLAYFHVFAGNHH